MCGAGTGYVGGAWLGGYQGGYTRVGIPGWVYRGVLPSHPSSRGASPDSEAGPGGPLQGVWSGWSGCSGRTVGGTGYIPTLRARSVLWPSLGYTPLQCPPGTNMARIDLISHKVSQNQEVSPEMLEKACHSPYFQNWVQMSPLGFLGFPFSRAFSGKELMTLF